MTNRNAKVLFLPHVCTYEICCMPRTVLSACQLAQHSLIRGDNVLSAAGVLLANIPRPCLKEVLLLECRLSAAETAPMDPQGRLLLEQSALSLRDANLRLKQELDPKTGVYVGVMHMEFIQYMNGEQHHLLACATRMGLRAE